VAEEFPVVFALYPHVTQLDFTGPHEVLARLPGARCLLASSTGGDVEADGGLLRGRRATSHWAWRDSLRRRPPEQARPRP
jgi:transcriptional regulator GlxA family with amidase domain